MIVGTGVDIIEINRIAKAIDRWGELFLDHVYTKEEQAWAVAHKHPFPHYAGRFAAKEAIFKALGDPQLSWLDLNILNDHHGKPIVSCNRLKLNHTLYLSISHCKDYAIAQAIVARQS